MKKRLFLAMWLCLLHAPGLFAQFISNTETSITIPYNTGCISYLPSGNYQVYIEYYDYDNGVVTRAPATGYYNCTLFMTYPDITIYIPAATLPTVNTTGWWDLSVSSGKLVLVNPSTSVTTERDFEYGFLLCPPLGRSTSFSIPKISTHNKYLIPKTTL